MKHLFIARLGLGVALFAVALSVYAAWLNSRRAVQKTVETFTPDLTIRIQCSGDCDLAAMIEEAREATNVEK